MTGNGHALIKWLTKTVTQFYPCTTTSQLMNHKGALSSRWKGPFQGWSLDAVLWADRTALR